MKTATNVRTPVQERVFSRLISLLPLAASLLCLALTAATLGVRYELNDDAIISNIAAGAYGEQTHFLVYVNVVFGWFLKPFYALAGGVNWFVLLLLAGAVACFAVVGVLLCRKWGLAAGGGLFLTLLVLVGVDFFQRFHYVKYATLFLVTGLLLVFLNLGRRNAALVAGVALAVLGGMIRFQMLPAVGGLAAPLLLWRFFTLEKPAKIRAVAAVGVLLVTAFGLAGIDTLAYTRDEGWAAYRRINALRTEISDFKLQFAEGPEVLVPLGMDITDYEMLDSWNFYDPEVFPPEVLQQVVDTLPGNTPGRALREAVSQGFKMLHFRPVGLVLCAAVLGWVFVSGKRRWPALVGILAVLGLELFYLRWQGRLPETILFALALAALAFCALCYEDKKEEQGKKPPRGWVGLVCVVMVVFSVPAFIGFGTAVEEYRASRPGREAEFDTFVQEEGMLYLADVTLVDAANGYDVLRPRPKGYFSNVVFTGGWLIYSPFQQEALARHGVENLYRDSLDRPDVQHLDLIYRALKEDYLRRHYAPGAGLEMVEEGISLRAYQALTKATRV